MLIKIPWKKIEVDYANAKGNEDYRNVVNKNDNALPLFEMSYFKSTNRYGGPKQIVLDSEGNFYFVYGQAIYVFDQNGKAKEVINGFKGSISDFELYKDGRIGLLTTSFDTFKRKGFWVTVLDPSRKVISEKKKDFDWTKTGPPELHGGIIKTFENSKKEWTKIEEEVSLSDAEKKSRINKSRFPGPRESPDGDNVKKYAPGNGIGYEDYFGEFREVDYFKIRGLRNNGKEKTSGFYIRKLTTGEYQFLLFPSEKNYFDCFRRCEPAVDSKGDVFYLIGDESGVSVYRWPVKW
ncbi:MAG: hypothetical protein ACHQYP_11715 [Nitrospiria bacterium]